MAGLLAGAAGAAGAASPASPFASASAFASGFCASGLLVSGFCASGFCASPAWPAFSWPGAGAAAPLLAPFPSAPLGCAALLAWLLWGAVHLVYLTDLWNRVQVFGTWVWAYLTFQRTVRVLAPDSLQSDIKVAPRVAAQPVGVNSVTAAGDEAPHAYTPGAR